MKGARGGRDARDPKEIVRNSLLNIPAGDVNFLSALERADRETLNEVLGLLEGKQGHKTRELALRRRLRQLAVGKAQELQEHLGQEPVMSNQDVVATANRQERAVGMELATLQGEREFESLQVELQNEKERDIAEAYETAGVLKGLGFSRKVVTCAEIVKLDLVKKSKGYKGIGTWDDYCKYVGLDRHCVDQQLKALHTFGEDFLVTITGFGLGYRDMRKLRQIALEGTITVDGECVTIGEERIPIKEEYAEDLQVAIERVLEDRSKLTQRVEKLEKDVKGVVDEETRGLKEEVKALVKEVKRLKPFDPGEKDHSFALDQVKGIKEAVSELSGLCLRFIADERVMDDPVLLGEVEGCFNAAELMLKDTRRRWESVVSVFDESI